MEQAHELEPAIVLLLVGILAIVLAKPLRVSPIVGYLVAGLLIGPQGLGLIQESKTTHLLAELGVVFLLFDIGLHFSLKHIWEARRDILGLGPLQVGLCTLCFTAIAMMLGLEPVLAIAVGAALALSSTAVVVQTLTERGHQNCPVGVSATAVLIFQDICAIFLLILATSLADSEASLGASLGLAGLKAAAAFIAAILIGRYLMGPLFRLLSGTRNQEIFTATALLIVLVTGAATGLAGLSLTLGAFLAGMIISETPYRQVIQTEVKPFRGLLLGFFFITVGLSLDLTVLLGAWDLILLAVAVLIGVKLALGTLAALILRTAKPMAIFFGFLLAQGSEFAFVIFGMAAVREGLGAEAASILITAVAASLALTPTLVGLGLKLAQRLASRSFSKQAAESASGDAVEPVVLFGMNEVGRQVADALEAHAIPYTAMEMDHDRFTRAHADGYPVAFGDAGDLRLMETIGVGERPAVIIALPRFEVSEALTPIVRERYPGLERYVAVDSEDDRERFAGLGMQAFVSRSVPRGLELAAAVLGGLGVEESRVAAWMRARQEQALATEQRRENQEAAA